jgi:hypothetical protein
VQNIKTGYHAALAKQSDSWTDSRLRGCGILLEELLLRQDSAASEARRIPSGGIRRRAKRDAHPQAGFAPASGERSETLRD